MFWKSVSIDGYIPFTHAGNTHVEIDFVKPCTAFLGTNGSGKSSLLRALDIWPATRTDYLKNGKIVKVIEHGGHIYELGSDFKNATAPHSFKKDGEELNISGTSDTQRDLIAEHIGITSVVDDIISGKVKICDLTKSERKKLFSSTYPSDLSFVLEYHKKVCSQIRTFANQIKLLQSREGSLTAALIDPAEHRRLVEFREGAEEIITRIDKVNLLLENEISQLRSSRAMQYPYHPGDLDGIEYKFNELRKNYTAQLMDHEKGRKLGESITIEDLGIRYARLNSDLRHLENQHQSLEDTIQDLRDELNKFTNLKYTSEHDKKTELTNELKVVTEEIESLKKDPFWEESPIYLIPKDKLFDVVEIVPDIKGMLAELHPYQGKIKTSEEMDKLKQEVYLAKGTASTLGSEREDLKQQLVKTHERLDKLSRNGYPMDCTRACGLRMTVESSIKETQLRIDSINERLKGIEGYLKVALETIENNTKILNDVNPALAIIKELWRTLSDNYLGDIALHDETLVDCLNTHCLEIGNRIQRAIEISKRTHRYTSLKDKYDQLTRTISLMTSVESTQMSAEVIDGIIREKERKIEVNLRKLTDISYRCNLLLSDLDRIQNTAEMLRNLDSLVEQTERCLNIKIIRNRIDFDGEMIREHTRVKNDLNSRLRDIERTLEDQKRITDILSTEIKPTLEQLKVDKAKWEAVESGLNPSKGLPCIYLARFINRLIAQANKYIAQVWCYDMELMFLPDNEDLDFTMSVLINKSTIVKDISLCSQGQKAIIDLAMTLAICYERNLFQEYGIKLDEVDGALTDEHRTRLVGMLSNLVDDGTIQQMFIVNHFAIQTGMSQCDTVCLSTDGIVVPGVYNEHAKIS